MRTCVENEKLALCHFERMYGKMEKLLSPKNISSNQIFSDFFNENVDSTKFLPKIWESKFL